MDGLGIPVLEALLVDDHGDERKGRGLHDAGQFRHEEFTWFLGEAREGAFLLADGVFVQHDKIVTEGAYLEPPHGGRNAVNVVGLVEDAKGQAEQGEIAIDVLQAVIAGLVHENDIVAEADSHAILRSRAARIAPFAAHGSSISTNAHRPKPP